MKWYLTQINTDHATTEEEILHNWHSGHSFKPYNYDGFVTNNDVLRMRMSGVTEIEIIYDRCPPLNQLTSVKVTL